MNWRALALAVAAVAAGPAQAQTIVARSGEHDGFTRLVMRLPDGVDWSLTQSGQSATLNLASSAAVFDTSRVFDMIPRTRLEELSQTAPGQPLRMDLDCNCDVKSYQMSNGYLVIDIRDGDDNPVYASNGSLQFPLTMAEDEVAQTPSGYRFDYSGGAFGDARLALGRLSTGALGRDEIAKEPRMGQILRPDLSQLEINPQPRLMLDPSRPAVLPLDRLAIAEGLVETIPSTQKAETQIDETAPVETPEVVSLPDVDLLMDLEESARLATVNASEQRLLQQIGRAANQGLLDVDIEEGGLAVIGDGTLNPLSPSGQARDALANISVSSAIDRELGLVAERLGQGRQESLCLRDGEVAVHRWGNDSPFLEQLAPLRSALVGEFDELNPASILSMVKLYIHFGFGAEAIGMLNMLSPLQVSEDRREVLTALAHLVEGDELPINHPFEGQQTCEGEVAFWAALADREIKRSAHTDSIQQGFGRLPAHLRVHLGPTISRMFSASEDFYKAESVLRAVTRTGVEDIPALNLAEAAIAEGEGDTETVVEKLTEEVSDRTENTPAALIELIVLNYRERTALSPDVPELAGSYELENRDTELGAELRKAEITALALTGRFHEAFQELKTLTRRDGPAARAAALEPLMILLTERADDVTFLQYVLVFSKQATAAEAGPVAETLARRLLDLGFAEQAQALLRKLALEPENEKRRLLSAEAALALAKPQRALVELMGLDSSDANRLRAQAYWQNGEFQRAGEFMLEEDKNAAARGFWHSQDIDALANLPTSSVEETQDAPFVEVADVTVDINETAQDPEGLTPLAHARALVESSQGTRGSIQDLLQSLGATPPAGN